MATGLISTIALVKPNPQAFETLQELPQEALTEELRVETEEEAASKVAQNILLTPPHSPHKPFQFSPSIIASPGHYLPMMDLHTVDGLRRANSRDMRGIRKGKPRHSIVLPGSAKKHADLLTQEAVRKYLSMCSTHLSSGRQGTPEPLEVEPGIFVSVLEPDHYLVEDANTGRKRQFGLHRQKDNPSKKRVYPRFGDGIFVASKSPDKPSPSKLIEIRENLRKKYKPGANLGLLFQQEWDSL